MKTRLAKGLDTDALQQAFRRDRFVHIPDVLHAKSADLVYQALLQGTRWNLCFNDRGKHIDLAPETVDAMDAGQHARLRDAVYAQATSSFQYFYNNYPIFDAWHAGLNKDHALHQFYEWMNSEAFLGFARTITGFEDIAFADAQATRFASGHFLSRHDDQQAGKNRRVAYIFNFTPEWQSDWGGNLQLLDDRQHVRRGIRPVFNSLNFLAVPQDHNVSMVTPFAQGARYAITGWLRY